MQGGDKVSERKLSRRQKKGGTYLIIAAILGLLAYGSYNSGNIQLAQGFGVLALLAILIGVVD